jgi:hypothetical protein
MKKKILSIIAVLAITAVATFNLSINNQKGNLSSVSLNDMEAKGLPIDEPEGLFIYKYVSVSCWVSKYKNQLGADIVPGDACPDPSYELVWGNICNPGSTTCISGVCGNNYTEF